MTLICLQEGKEYRFDIPFSSSDVTFSNFLDFRAADQRYLTSDGDSVFERMIECIGTVASGDWDMLPVYLEGDESIQKNYTIEIGIELSIVRVYSHLRTIMSEDDDNDKISNDTKILYKGDEYIVHTYFNSSMTAGEFIETLELERTVGPSIQKGDPDGILEFQLGLRQMAILLRKPGEKLPSRKGDRDKWIKDRAKYLEELPLSVVVQVRHFFFRSMTEYLLKESTRFSLKESLRNEQETGAEKVKTSGRRSDGTQFTQMQSK